MVNNQSPFCAANHTFFCAIFKLLQLGIRNNITELAATNTIAVCSTAGAAPAIQAITLLIVQRKILGCTGLLCFTAGALQQFHAFKDNAFRVGFPFSSFIGPGIPDILAQNDVRRLASFSVFGCGAGGFRFIPCFLALARPLAFKPPLGFLPSLRVHAGVLAMINPLSWLLNSHQQRCCQQTGRLNLTSTETVYQFPLHAGLAQYRGY